MNYLRKEYSAAEKNDWVSVCVFGHGCASAQHLHRFSIWPCVKAKYKNMLCLHNSLEQKLSITFICFCIDSENDQIIIHKT